MFRRKALPAGAVLVVLSLAWPAWSACLDALALLGGETACAMMMKAERDCDEAGEVIRCCLEDSEHDTRFTVVAKAPSENKPLLLCAAPVGLATVELSEPASSAAAGAFVQARLKLPSDPTYLRLSVFRI